MSRALLSGVAALALAAPLAPSATAGPATPQDLNATNGATSITLTWSQPTSGSRPVGFRVYEGSTVVARNTTTHATIGNLVFLGSHTYTVTAVDSLGRESPPTAPVTRRAIQGGPFGCGLTAPTGLVATGVTASAVSLSWSNAQPYWDAPGTLVVLLDSTPVQQTSLDSARIGGLTAGATHTFQVARRDCNGQMHASAPLSLTTAPGTDARPPAPTGLTVTARTNASIDLTWAPQAGTDAVTGYAVYDGGTVMARTRATTVTVAGLWRDTPHVFTVAALDSQGNESAGSGPATATTLPCDQPVPAPVALAATPVSASSVALSWVSTVEATGFGVYRVPPGGGTPTLVSTVATPTAMITGLPSATGLGFAVLARTAACGASGLSASVAVTTPSGPAARPAAPSGLTMLSDVPTGTGATVTLSWSQPAGSDAVTGYRLYEGAAVLGTSQSTGITLQLPSGPTHVVSVVAVDAAGQESAPSGTLTFVAVYIPVP